MDWVERFAKKYNKIKLEEYIDNSSEKIYHYTLPSAFQNIIEKGQLRFTDKLYLNDKSEGIYSLQVCLDNIDNVAGQWEQKHKELLIAKINIIKDHFSEYFSDKMFYLYQCSFSLNGDSLCLWNYYSKNIGIQGYNLQFDSAILNDSLELKSKLENGEVPSFIYGKVIYNKQKQIKIICDIAKVFYDFWKEEKKNDANINSIIDYFIDKIIFIGTFFKDEHFSVEEEYRFAIKIYMDENGQYLTLKNELSFFEKSGLFIPYIDVDFKHSALLSVGVSPTIDSESAKDCVMRIAVNYPNLKKKDSIRFSEIPIRY